MPELLLFPWVSLSLVALAIGAALAWREPAADRARREGCFALAVAAAALVAARLDVGRGAPEIPHLEPWLPGGWFGVDALNAVPLPLFATLALGAVIAAPRRKVTPRWTAGVLLLAAATLAAYAAQNLLVMTLAWAVSVVPFVSTRFFTVTGDHEIPAPSRGALVGGVVCLAAGAAVLVAARLQDGAGWGAAIGFTTPSAGRGTMQLLAFGLLLAAVVLRKGLLPIHSWLVAAFERGPLLPLILLVNAQLGAFLVARVALPLLPDVARDAPRLLGDYALLTAAYTAGLVLVERQPRRLLALLAISQASFMLVGITSASVRSIAGALVYWQVVTVASTMLGVVYLGLEARVGTEMGSGRYLGLADGAPRLAVFFLVGGLALVGLPLTLGFCAEDLLLQGTLNTHPRVGFVMPVVTAFNAFSVLRLFARLFLGPVAPEARGVADALPRERWALTAAMLFLILGGLVPGPLLRMPGAAAERLAEVVRAVPAPREPARASAHAPGHHPMPASHLFMR